MAHTSQKDKAWSAVISWAAADSPHSLKKHLNSPRFIPSSSSANSSSLPPHPPCPHHHLKSQPDPSVPPLGQRTPSAVLTISPAPHHPHDSLCQPTLPPLARTSDTTQTEGGGRENRGGGRGGGHSLLVVVLAVELPVAAVAGPGERLEADDTFHAPFVPRALVDSQEEAVGDGGVAAGAHLPHLGVRTWAEGEAA